MFNDLGQLSRRELEALSLRAEQLATPSFGADFLLPGGAGATAQPILPQPPFWAKITGLSGNAYAFLEVVESNFTPDVWLDPGLRSDDGLATPAYEVTGNRAVPVDGSAIARMYLSDDASHYLFAWQGGASPTYTAVTVSPGAGGTFLTVVNPSDPSKTVVFEVGNPVSQTVVWPDALPTSGNQVLKETVLGGVVTLVWANASPLTTKGDLWGFDTADDRVPVGNDGFFLAADSTQALGLVWRALTLANLPAGTAQSDDASGTGTTTAAFVTVWDVTNAGGTHGSFTLRNTHAANSIKYQITVKDLFGTSATSSVTTLAALATIGYRVDALTSTLSGGIVGIPLYAPFQEVKLEVEDAVAASHATYSWYRSFVG